MKDVSKRLNETEAKIQETTINNSTLKLNQTGVNSSEENSNGTEIEENRLFPTWTPLSTTEYPTTLTLFNRRPRPKPILEISNENLSEDLTIQTTQLTNQLTTQLMTQLTADVHKPLPEKCCGSKEEEQLDQSSSHFKIMYDLKTFVIHFILIILCFI